MNSPDFQAAGLDSAALSENRSGRITEAQATAVLDELRALERKYRLMAAMMIGMFVLMAIVKTPPPEQRIWFAAAALGGPLIVVLLTRSIASPIKRDVAEGKVLSIDGPITRLSASRSSHFMWIGDKLLTTNRTVYRAFNLSDKRYRAFYLPRTSKLVNLELLA